MPITLPSYVAPNELIASAWGNAVVDALAEIDAEKVDNAGDTMSGSLLLDGGSVRAGTTVGTQFQAVDTAGADNVYISFYGAASGITAPTLGTRTASIGQFGDADLQLRAEATGGDIILEADSAIIFKPLEIERSRMVGNAFLFGKTAANLDTAGTEVYGTGATALGSIRTTTSAAGIQTVYCRHMSAADANGESFADFTRTGAAQLGSITQVSTTGVAFNTTSDERLKTVLRELDDDEIAEILRTIAPVVFEFKSDPGNEHVGFIAQQLAATWPTFIDVGIVTPGHGEPGDVDQFDEDGVVVSRRFRPWMVDLSKLTPLLVAGWQQIDRRLAVLEAS